MFECTCGERIEEEPYPSKTCAYVLTEIREEKFTDDIASEFESYATALKAGRESEWLSRRAGKDYPADLSGDTVAYDIVGNSKRSNMKKMYECAQCGTLYIERHGQFVSFHPLNIQYQKVLDE